MHLTDILSPDQIRVPMQADEKQAAIRELVDLLAAKGAVTDAEAMFQAVMERERTRTTGIGNGLAIPHGKSNAATDLTMAIGLAGDNPIDFQAIDDKPVSLIVLLVSPPEKTGLHIQALARLSRLLTVDAFRKSLLSSPSAQAAYQAILQREQMPD